MQLSRRKSAYASRCVPGRLTAAIAKNEGSLRGAGSPRVGKRVTDLGGLRLARLDDSSQISLLLPLRLNRRGRPA